ncbi:Squalestatin S1 biosynthesis cluster protein L1 [Fulvia fulva]|uniref:Squalestatin S1 biosynthesis cluster protein L1 n=1 Tax=Passalora fulva TaxID=5499 RepID=A0A9Q8LF23_PASFU|nr:Squalestatin S1 biosynthesis cluster protein L1 [Fulvia fulva]KAK4629455.1 Squalestatin S1 biosynthesis cluster protein L1 [Fulvia fulva]KAK4630138.1 Squalestatin S1 biosynthesis cluster protein L1 [Fulvia fulva]UJO15503.1 Squalestatin S1 biosynthesis cluster protein L1 [Fulvia fulva]WPV12775.1 Squalestatin S1 biosynthesis cluster protein L1 [Fulvia fulva]WPV26996.1 Squalestatin S1 biosynthesis cluster protein L1 [Fulvia fulva]
MRNLLSQLLALGPELAVYILALPLLASRPTHALTQNAISSPNLDLSQLGRVAIGGDFDSVSLYRYEGQNENLSSNGSQSLLTRYPDGAWQSLGLVDADATIMAMCPFVAQDGTNNGVIVGGNFTSLKGVQASSIGLWNPNDNSVTALPGLTGPVRALYCDQESGTVYVGGNFMGGNSTNAMAWVTGWQNLPFAGFNGPVNSITKNSAGNIVFGGEFTGLGNASTPSTPDAQVVNIGGGRILASATTGSTSTDQPQDIVCSTSANGTNWLLPDHAPGFWQGEYGFGFVPTKLRLYNANVNGRGTKEWLFRRLDDNGILNMTYVDPVTGQNMTCDQKCPLPENNSTAQDFHFVNSVGVSKFQIEINEWYGAGGGLSGIELFQDDIYSYAVDNFNEPRCNGLSSGSSSTISPNDGTWVQVANRGYTASDFLSSTLSSTDKISFDTNVVFRPNIQQSGNYSVTVYTPGCVQDGTCGTRGQVNMTGSMTSEGAPITTTLFQTNNYDKFDQIYYGYIDVDQGAFAPSVTLSPVLGQAAPLTVVASRVRFELISTTDGGLNGLYEYNSTAATTDSEFSNSAINTAGSDLDTGARINAFAQGEDALYVAGSFSNNDMSNIMSVADRANALPGRGLNGEILGMRLNGTSLYVVGTFDNTADRTATGLNNVAVFSTSDNQWSALGAGVNASVFDIVPLAINVTSDDQQDCLALSGNFTSVNAFDGNAAFEVEGFAIWVPSQRNWLQNIANASVALNGYLSTYTEIPDMTPLYAGTVRSQGLGYADAIQLVGSGNPTIETLGVRLQQSTEPSEGESSSMRKRALADHSSGQNYTGVYNGIFYHQNNLNITILGGNFAATSSNGSTVENLVFINNTETTQTVNGVDGLDADSIIVAMDTYGTLVFAGGAINGTVNGNDATGLVVFDLSANRFASPHPPALGGDNVVVNAVATQPESSVVYVGGSFDTAGSLQCRTLCSYDAGIMQWQNVVSGLSGTINTMVWASNTELIIAGNLTIEGNATTMATYNSKKQTLEEYAGGSTLPGPIIALSAVSNKYDEFWISGVATANSSVYLAKYADNTWTGAGGLGESTTIRKLQIMPLTSDHADSDLMAKDQSLMILGDVNIPGQGNASAVLFNGTTYEPYILTNMQDGTQGSLSAIFVSNPQNLMDNSGHQLALGLVVVIGLAISLALIFLMVVIGILLERRRRRKEGYVPMTVDKSSNIARLPPETLFQNLEGKNPPQL